MCDEWDGADYEPPGFRDDTSPRARKPHRCIACHEAIQPGHRYHRTVEHQEGEIRTYRHCLRCWAMIEALDRRGVEFVDWDLNCGEVWQDPPVEVAELAFLAPEEAQARFGGAAREGRLP